MARPEGDAPLFAVAPRTPQWFAVLLVGLVVTAPGISAGQVLIASEPFLVEGGPGTQTEPHVSGSRVSFTSQDATTSQIHYADLAAGGSPSAIDNTGGTYRDSISDVSGTTIVFKRAGDLSSTEAIMAFDTAKPSAGAQELSPAPGTQRQAAAIGGTTVAFEQRTSSTLIRDICIASTAAPSAPAYCVTSSDLMNRDPAVSPDGNTVVWARCTGLLSGCDIWAVSKNASGGWDAPRALTTGGGNDLFPDTNGTVVTYASNLDGDSDIYVQNLDGTGAVTRLAAADVGGSQEENPNISGARIAFQRRTAVGEPADLYIYDLATASLFQLTATVMDEKLNDLSTDASGQSWVVWAALDPATGSDDVWAAQFSLASSPPCEEPRTPEAICADPRDRELLMDATVVRTPGRPNSFARTFAATDGERGVMCASSSPGSSAWVELNGELRVRPDAFDGGVTSVAQAVTLQTSNFARGTIASEKGLFLRVRIYGGAELCSGAP